MVLSRSRLVAPALAVALALVAILTHAEGVDVAAATYRVGLFARSGLTLWDSQWYGGHWTLNYSVIFAPIGWLTGIPLMEIFCVAVAAWAFDRLAVARFGRSGRIAALVFAAGTIVQVSIGQEPYLLGETIGLVALVAAHARHWRLAMALAVACALASPLTGGFMALAALAWMVGVWPAHRWALVGLAAAATVPVGVLELLFPGQGMMPFATLNFIGMTLALPRAGRRRRRSARPRADRRHRDVRRGARLHLCRAQRDRRQHHAPGDQLRRRAGRRARGREPARARAAPRGRRADRARPVGARDRPAHRRSSARRCGPRTSVRC